MLLTSVESEKQKHGVALVDVITKLQKKYQLKKNEHKAAMNAIKKLEEEINIKDKLCAKQSVRYIVTWLWTYIIWEYLQIH